MGKEFHSEIITNKSDKGVGVFEGIAGLEAGHQMK
jgi:hypothetical protein